MHFNWNPDSTLIFLSGGPYAGETRVIPGGAPLYIDFDRTDEFPAMHPLDYPRQTRITLPWIERYKRTEVEMKDGAVRYEFIGRGF